MPSLYYRNGVRLKSCCRHFVDALTRVAVGRCFADKLFERGHVGAFADADNTALSRVVGVPAEVELSCVRARVSAMSVLSFRTVSQ